MEKISPLQLITINNKFDTQFIINDYTITIMNAQKVYVVTDCGTASPTYGFICGIFDSLELAKVRLENVKASSDYAWMGSQIDDIEIREFTINQPING